MGDLPLAGCLFSEKPFFLSPVQLSSHEIGDDPEPEDGNGLFYVIIHRSLLF